MLEALSPPAVCVDCLVQVGLPELVATSVVVGVGVVIYLVRKVIAKRAADGAAESGD